MWTVMWRHGPRLTRCGTLELESSVPSVLKWTFCIFSPLPLTTTGCGLPECGLIQERWVSWEGADSCGLSAHYGTPTAGSASPRLKGDLGGGSLCPSLNFTKLYCNTARILVRQMLQMKKLKLPYKNGRNFWARKAQRNYLNSSFQKVGNKDKRVQGVWMKVRRQIGSLMG